VTERATRTPQMVEYDRFDDRGEVNYQPYVMYWNRAGYRSDVINTDELGFRVSHGPDGRTASVARCPSGPIRLFAGTSTALGTGVTSDARTIASRLWTEYAPSTPWLNFAARSLSSAQEAIAFMLYQHLLPDVQEVVLMSGFNNLILSRLPAHERGPHGAFFFCGEYFEAMDALRARHRKQQRGISRLLDRKSDAVSDLFGEGDRGERGIDEFIAEAVELTQRHLKAWLRLLGPSVPLTYVLQPLSTWYRDEPSTDERALFDELDRTSKYGTWEGLYGDVSSPEAGAAFARALDIACAELGVRFVDMNQLMAKATTSADWLYVDRAHCTDHGNDLIARFVASELDLR
jgi:hypothetical protein